MAVLQCCGISVRKIPHCGVAVISNPAVCVVCVFKPPVFIETKLFAVLRFLVGPLQLKVLLVCPGDLVSLCMMWSEEQWLTTCIVFVRV